MKLKFKNQAYQANAVVSVVDCFSGQLRSSGIKYRIDPGRVVDANRQAHFNSEVDGFKNSDITLHFSQLLDNVHIIQRRQNLPLSAELVHDKRTGCSVNLDIEMETGTGKTYCYIKTMFELYKHYGWNKFIVVVPSIAIRGVRPKFHV
jgi:type III restriction enzyme